MDQEMLAALKRIEAVARYHGDIAGLTGEVKDAFDFIATEASEAITKTKEQADGI